MKVFELSHSKMQKKQLELQRKKELAKKRNPDITKQYDITVEPNSFKAVDEIAVKKTSILQLSFLDEVLTEIFTVPTALSLKKAAFTTKLEGNRLTIKSTTFAYNIFIESDEILGFENTGIVYAPEFIEDNTLILGETEFHFGELVER